MLAKKEQKGIRFKFRGDYEIDDPLDQKGRVQCDICAERFASPDLEVDLDGFTICPVCLQAGPAAVTAMAKRIAGDKEWIARGWGYTNLGSPLTQKDVASMAKLYRKLVAGLRGIRSFEDLPGGKMALGVAEILQAPAAGRKRRAA